MSEATTSTDHDEIRKWAEERGGVPATVKGTAKGKKGSQDKAGILRLDFEPRDEELEEMDWDEFFEKFDAEKLAFLHQDKTADGKVSRFHKFVNRAAAEKSGGKSASAGKASGAKSSGEAKSVGAGKSGGAAKSKESGSKAVKSSGASKAGAAKSGGDAKAGGDAKSAGKSGGETKTQSAGKSGGGAKSQGTGKSGANSKS